MKKTTISIATIITMFIFCFTLSSCTCEICHGSKEKECSSCYGTGIHHETCSQCNGTGFCEDCGILGYERVKCSSCDGDGFFMNPVTWETFDCSCDYGYLEETCGRCGGSGDCYMCDGEGRITCDEEEKCSECSGTGIVPCDCQQ